VADIVVVCTGNICRSPIAEGALRAVLRERFGDEAPTVASMGTAGWAGSRADPFSVSAAAERGVDIGAHRARRTDATELRAAQLVVAMAGEHREELVDVDPALIDTTFTLKEIVRLLEALPPQAGEPADLLHRRVRAAAELRRNGFAGNAMDEDVIDPLGMPAEAFRAVAWELGEWSARLADGLFGRSHARAVGDGT
jgi:protein-tyrosine phosphatase